MTRKAVAFAAATVAGAGLTTWQVVTWWTPLFGQRSDWAAGGNLLMWVFGGVAGFWWQHTQSERRHREALEADERRHRELLARMDGDSP